MTLIETSNLVGAALAMRRGANPWTQERLDILTTLWKEGQSATYILRRLDHPFSRSAILGKVHRMGLSKGPDVKPHAKTGTHWANSRRPDSFRRKALPKDPTVSRSRAANYISILAVPPRPEIACTFAQLGEDMCRYPFGEPGRADFAFCGRPAVGTYCPGHHQLCYRRGE
jgi:GcrA cell cycle regulator